MKLPLLLTRFLYKNKRLALPGIGVFILDPSAVIPDEQNKDIRVAATGIEFKNTAVHEPDDALIEYIRVNTGKIRPLVMADLDSFLALGTEMLNIGKPFILEGIGMLTRTKERVLEFTPGEYAIVKEEGSDAEKAEKPVKKKTVYEEMQQEHELQPNGVRKFVLALALIGGLGVIAWGGFMMYKKNSVINQHDINTASDTGIKTDTAQLIAAKDSVAKNTTAIAPAVQLKDSNMYKFIILETANKARALKRYNQLLSYDLKINMYTKDSSFFKVYFTFPALAKDTVHIKDSLLRQYAHQVIIER